jgi:hypothetical protein
MRECQKCKSLKPPSDYGVQKTQWTNTCIECFQLEARRRHFKSKYKITLEEYELLYEKQQGKCAICGCKDTGNRRYLSVDHCHTTKAIRGLLCQACNKAIGLFKDNPILLKKASKYLQNKG